MMRAPVAALGLRVHVYEKGAAGVPDTSFTVAELSGRITEYQHSIFWQFGFESMSCSFVADMGEALDWLRDGPGRSTVVYGPDAETVWEGRLVTVEAQFGQERRALSLDGLANRVRVRYTTVLGTPGVIAALDDTASQALYGIKDAVYSLGNSDSTEAGDYGYAMLRAAAQPLSHPSSDIATGDLGGVTVTLTFEGWYGALGDVVTSNTSTTKTSTTTQVGTLITAYNSTNNFFSTDYSNIIASGVTATEYIAPDTTYREKIETLLARGNGTDVYFWGVFAERTFYADIYGGEDTNYQRSLGTADLYDDNNNLVRPWNARPNKYYQVLELLETSPQYPVYDTEARWYVARVSLTINESGHQLALEPREPSDLSAVLVTKYPN